MTYIGMDRLLEQQALRVINRLYDTPTFNYTMLIMCGCFVDEVWTEVTYNSSSLSTEDITNMPAPQTPPDHSPWLRILPHEVGGQILFTNPEDPEDEDLPIIHFGGRVTLPTWFVSEDTSNVTIALTASLADPLWKGLKGWQVTNWTGYPIKMATVAAPIGEGEGEILSVNVLLPSLSQYGFGDRHKIDMATIDYLADHNFIGYVQIYDNLDHDLRLNGSIVTYGETFQLVLAPNFQQGISYLFDIYGLLDIPTTLSIAAAALVSGVNAALTPTIIQAVGSDKTIQNELVKLGIQGSEALLMVGAAIVFRHMYGLTNMMEDLVKPQRLLKWIRASLEPAQVLQALLAAGGTSVLVGSLTGSTLSTLSSAALGGLTSLIMTALDDIYYEVDFQE